MTFKGQGELITSTVNAQVYVEIVDTFLILLIENCFGSDVVIFHNYTATEQEC